MARVFVDSMPCLYSVRLALMIATLRPHYPWFWMQDEGVGCHVRCTTWHSQTLLVSMDCICSSQSLREKSRHWKLLWQVSRFAHFRIEHRLKALYIRYQKWNKARRSYPCWQLSLAELASFIDWLPAPMTYSNAASRLLVKSHILGEPTQK